MSEDAMQKDYEITPAQEALLREQSRNRGRHPLEDSKTTAPTQMSNGLSPRRAAELWGTNSAGFPGDGIRRRYPYSKT
jgi:hypothetical protein